MMERSLQNQMTCGAIVILAIAFFVPYASAQDRDWGFDLSICGWMPAIKGQLAYDVPGLGDTVVVDPGTLIENLQFNVQGSFGVRHGKWSILADVIHKKRAKSSDILLNIGPGINLSATFTLISWIVSLSGAYEVVRTEGGTTLGVLAGARYFYVHSSLFLEADGSLQTSQMVDKSTTVWNGFAGVRGRIGLSKHWFIPYHVDIGLGGSEFSWQGLSGIGYDFLWGDLILVYRYLDFNQGDSSIVRRLSFGGGEFTIAFRF